MQSVDFSSLDRLSERLLGMAEEFPEIQRKLHDELSETLLRIVHGNISNSVNDTHGRIRGYQSSFVGSRGGYAAVRAMSGRVGANSPGAITNYLENGHQRRRPSGRSRRKYYGRIRSLYIAGRHFYNKSRTESERQLIQAAERVINQVAEEFRSAL